MLELLLGVLLFLGVLTLCFFIAYYVTVMMSTSTDAPKINILIMTNMTILTQNVVNTVSDTVQTVTSTGLSLLADALPTVKKYASLGILMTLCFSYMINREDILSSADKLWRCGVNPFFQNVVFTIIEFLRLIWGAIIPLYNYILLIVSQITTGTGITILKCNILTLFDSLVIVLNIMLSNFQSLAKWSGASQGISEQNNILVNEFNVTGIVLNVQSLVLKQADIAPCVCSGLTDAMEFIFIFFRQEELALSINHFVNIPVSMFQTLLQVVPPWSRVPGLANTINHVNGFIYYGMKFLDQVLIKSSIHLLSLFDANLELAKVPQEIVFAIIGRLVMAGVHFLWTIVRIATAFAVPLKQVVGDADYMIEVFSLAKTMEQINLAIISMTSSVSWGMQVQDTFARQLLRAAKDGTALQISVPEFSVLKCAGTTEIKDNIMCGVRMGLFIAPDLIYVLYTMFVELFWKGIVHREETILPLFQRYDGISFPAGKELSCEYRDSIDFDMTSGDCRCDENLGTYLPLDMSDSPFGKTHYEKYCEQPTLQSNYFGNVERFIKYMSGDLALAADLFTKPFLMFNEGLKILIKAALNIENIVTGDYFQYKNNCGYGLSSSTLRNWWSTTQKESFSNLVTSHQDDQCKNDMINYYHPVEYVYKCKLIDTAIRDMMCLSSSNSHGRVNALTGQAQYVPRCTVINKESCECNWALPLQANTKCRCIRNFPDEIMEFSQTAYNNPVLELIHSENVSRHWCNTYWAEKYLYQITDYTDIVENAITVFHPSYSINSTQYCEKNTFTLFSTKLLQYPLWRFNRDDDIYEQLELSYTENSCKLYGSTDFTCNVGLTVRSSVAIFVNQIRATVMSITKIIEFDFTGIKITFSERLCDTARAAAAISSLVPSILPDEFVNKQFQKGISQMVYAYFSTPIVFLDAVNYGLAFLQDVVTGKINWSLGPARPIFHLIFSIVNAYIDWLRQALQATGNTLNGIQRNAGKGLLGIDKMIKIVQKYLINEATFELADLLAAIVIDTAEFFTSGQISEGIGSFFRNLFTLVKKALVLAVKSIGRVVSAILTLMGPAGDFIREMATTICGRK